MTRFVIRIALVAGSGLPEGLVVVAGTGSIAYGVNADAVAARSGGWGPVLADEGSGYWIGRHALVAIMRHADGRGPRTALTPMVLEHLGLSRPDDLVNEVYEGAERRQLVATLGQLVDRGLRRYDGATRRSAGCCAGLILPIHHSSRWPQRPRNRWRGAGARPKAA